MAMNKLNVVAYKILQLVFFIIDYVFIFIK